MVYEAQQLGLNRTVALKVIRPWLYSDPSIAARFRAEAEAAARFAHPNIIHVYEIGEHDGQGYLALEYASGGSLHAKLAGIPQRRATRPGPSSRWPSPPTTPTAAGLSIATSSPPTWC